MPSLSKITPAPGSLTSFAAELTQDSKVPPRAFVVQANFLEVFVRILFLFAFFGAQVRPPTLFSPPQQSTLPLTVIPIFVSQALFVFIAHQVVFVRVPTTI